MIDGVLVVDKPRGLTSHDVVAAARRALREKRIGHTGTLDPLATGVLPLACGRATRLVRFLSESAKAYEAEIRLGVTTDTYDSTGREIARCERRPSREEIEQAVAGLAGEYRQTPPPYSAKKIAGRRSYELARSDVGVRPAPVLVRSEVSALDIRGDIVAVTLTCSAGFYVRSFAQDLGERLGTGACLAGLRRTRSGEFELPAAVSLDVVVGDPAAALSRLVPLAGLLPGWPAVRVTEEGLRWVLHGRPIGANQLVWRTPEAAAWVRVIGPDGALVALGEAGEEPGSLHPSVVLI